jgi:hypothetical protein
VIASYRRIDDIPSPLGHKMNLLLLVISAKCACLLVKSRELGSKKVKPSTRSTTLLGCAGMANKASRTGGPGDPTKLNSKSGPVGGLDISS